jgi:hypothetical protein
MNKVYRVESNEDVDRLFQEYNLDRRNLVGTNFPFYIRVDPNDVFSIRWMQLDMHTEEEAREFYRDKRFPVEFCSLKPTRTIDLSSVLG